MRSSTYAEYSRDLGAKCFIVPGRLVPVTILTIKLVEERGADDMQLVGADANDGAWSRIQ